MVLIAPYCRVQLLISAACLQFLVNTLSWYYALNGINILLVIARILNLMHFQPRLGVVTRSLLLAGPDLLHFTVVAGIVFVGYAMMAHVIFGNVIEKFSSFRQSIDTCFEMLLGEISVNEDLKALTGLQVCWHLGPETICTKYPCSDQYKQETEGFSQLSCTSELRLYCMIVSCRNKSVLGKDPK